MLGGISLPKRLPDKRKYLRGPKQDMTELKQIKKLVYAMSYLIRDIRGSSFKDNNTMPMVGLDSEDLHGQSLPDFKWHRVFRTLDCKAKLPALFSRMLHARNQLSMVCQMVLLLKMAGILEDRVSILIKEASSRSVVQLLPIFIRDIFSLAEGMEDCIENYLIPGQGIKLTQEVIVCAGTMCKGMLDHLYCPYNQQHASSSTSSPKAATEIALWAHWARVASLLDLAVVSYCGGHTFATENPLLLDTVNLSTGGIFSSETMGGCMNDFWKGYRIWVFKPDETASESPMYGDQSSLSAKYIQADILTLSDVWDPARARPASEGSSRIMQYHIGNGIIFPWNGETDSKYLQEGLRSCHWLPHASSLIDLGYHVNFNALDTNQSNESGPVLTRRSITTVGRIRPTVSLMGE